MRRRKWEIEREKRVAVRRGALRFMFGWLFKARGGESSGNGKEPEMAQFVKKVEQIISAAPLVVFSKTTCGYCSRGK